MRIDSEQPYDFVIVGAGPAGLAAGIAAARKGMKAVVLEKGAVAGPLPRGEGVNRYPLFDDLLGSDFLETRCYRMDGSLEFHSPFDRKQVLLAGNKDIYFFEWRQFMDRLVEMAVSCGVSIRYNSKVIGPLVNKTQICIGVRCRQEDGAVREIYGKAVLACDGHKSVMGRHYGVDYDRLNCAMVKGIIRNANIDISQKPVLQFFLVGNGDLRYAPNLPPCVAYAFPLGGRKMEVGLMLRMGQASQMGNTVRIPGNKTFSLVWTRLKEEYPGFSSFFKGAEMEYEAVTALTNAGMVSSVIPAPGLVLIGDSAGFVDPFGSSGIYSSMAMATFWTELLSNESKKIAAKRKGEVNPTELWRPGRIAKYKKVFRRTGIYRHIRKSYARIGKFEWYVFKHLRTAERINSRWRLISFLLRRVA